MTTGKEIVKGYSNDAIAHEFADDIAAEIDTAISAAVQAETTRCAKVAQSMIGATRREIADAIRARKDVTK